MSRLHFKKYPEQDGTYIAGNHSQMYNRLEIEKVMVIGQDVFVEDDKHPFIFTDFDFWSDIQEQTK